MRRGFGAAGMAGFGFAGLVAFSGPAGADIIIAVDKAAQRMAVTVDGKQQYLWKVSTGTGGAPKAGTYQPLRLEKSWFSRKYDMSPMPHSIFFHEGIAIHGTQYVSRLGNAASHGCVRLAPANAATLFNLVRAQGMASTTIVVTHSGWPDLAKLAPKLEAKPEAKPEPKPSTEAPIKADLPAAHPPKLNAPVTTTPIPATLKPKPDRVLLERHLDTMPGTTGVVLVRPAEPPALASSGSKPVALPDLPK
jgi:hypothetical protein